MTTAAEPAPTEPADPLQDGIVATLMAHAADGNGAVNYPKAAAAFAALMAEMIGPQPLDIRKKMISDFQTELHKQIQLCALRTSVIHGGKR